MKSDQITILLVEDDETLRFIVKDNLEQNNYSVVIAGDGEEAIKKYSETKFSLIILDIMLPKKDGFEVAKTIRKIDANVPILFLTARSMTEDKIHGLTIGGDDYMTKPFSMEELLLKIKVFLRRSISTSGSSNEDITSGIKLGKFVFHPDELFLEFGGNKRKLTLKEVELIKLFSENKNKVLNRDQILEKVWGSNDYFLGRSLDVFISRLRKYFKEDPSIQIINIHGLGFRFSIKTN